MNLINTELSKISQHFDVPKDIRYKYGEINTPFYLIEKILDLIDPIEFKNPNNKWLDIGTGCGYFSIVLFKRLHKSLSIIKNEEDRKNHIIENMIYMTEIRTENCKTLRDLFGANCNLYEGNYLEQDINISFDFVIGNPPYNNDGIKSVPTNTTKSKNTFKTVWIPFIKKSVNLLKPFGKMAVIIPSIWMKRDKAKMNDFLLQYKLEKIHCMSNTKTNQIFKYAQTPTCYFLLTKTKSPGYVTLYDYDIKKYLIWNIKNTTTIPVFGCNILLKIIKFLNDDNKLIVYKTGMPKKNTQFYKNLSYKNVNTCLIKNNKPTLSINTSDKPQQYYGKSKLIFSHKMYGFPYLDIEGEYGISNRDNYVIINDNVERLIKLKEFFLTKLALYLFEATRYRMKYLEIYIFELIPDITKLHGFPENINNDSVCNYFGITLKEKEYINNFSKDYDFTEWS